ncbi:MAG TPA: H-type small acid-soluble spore protein [Bacillales bacterium]|nr:H-type small acid-soluble spore protein [Bacillales bacterium]
MDAKRALEIIGTEEEVKVTYRGSFVWIDTVDSMESTATVHRTSAPEDEFEVPLQDLAESAEQA